MAQGSDLALDPQHHLSSAENGSETGRLEDLYELKEDLLEMNGAIVRRAIRKSDGFPVLIKALSSDRIPRRIREIRNEFEIGARLEGLAVAKPMALGTYRGLPALVLEDSGGEPLERRLGSPMEMGAFLPLAIGITGAVAEMHRRDVVHKDLKPSNILVNPQSGRVELTGFGISAFLPSRGKIAGRSTFIEGSLPYMSPEQTGRTNRGLDQRSDLYSLGVTFYEMSVGRRPFQAGDPLEWMHAHIAVQPTAPSQSAPKVPGPVSDIIMKLLAKEADGRYRTARGLMVDLEKCLARWESHGSIAPFPLGEGDLSDWFQIPQSLFGREQDFAVLLDAFAHVAETGKSELVMVSGYSGIGKSSLVRELRGPVMQRRGFFAEGKFDPYKAEIPYSTLVQAFTELLLQLMSEGVERNAGWKDSLQSALGINGQLVVDVIPQVALLIGPQPAVPILPAMEARNRFRMVFRNFIGVFARPEHPLVLFLDDLQWADSESLELIRELPIHSEPGHMLMVGAYRSNEATRSHPMFAVLESIRKARVRVYDLPLGQLSSESLGRLVAETLRLSPAEVAALRDLILEKTGGNPFFALQFLVDLHEERLIRFDGDSGKWTWDVPAIRAKGLTENVVDYMVEKLRRLDELARETLVRFACMGSAYEPAIIALILECPEAEALDRLSNAVKAGFLVRLGENFGFVHDKVREAAYSLVPMQSRASEHLRIGRLLLAQAGEGARLDERVFDVVGQLNRGSPLITDKDEINLVRRLNFTAGMKAKRSAAFASARAYLAQSTALLPSDAWIADYTEAFEANLELSECEYITGHAGIADGLFSLLLAKAASRIDRARVYILRVKFYQVSGRFSDAFVAAVEAMGLFGFEIPDSEPGIQQALAAEIREIPVNMGGRSIAGLADAPEATEPEARMAIALLAEAQPIAYGFRPALFQLLIYKGLNFILTHGNTSEACRVYNAYSVLLVSAFGDLQSANEFSELALRLNEKFDDRKLRGLLVHIRGACILPWRKPIALSLPYLKRAFQACLEVGDLPFAGYNSVFQVLHSLEKGDPLDEVLETSRKHLAFAVQISSEPIALLQRSLGQFIANLQGRTRTPQSFDDDAFHEGEILEALTKAGFGSGLAAFHILKLTAACHHGLYAEAWESASRAEPHLREIGAQMIEADYHFFRGLTLAARYPEASEEDREGILSALTAHLEKMRFWANGCPENFLCRQHLLAAEQARILGRTLEAMRLYESSIRSARENGFIQIVGLANDSAARFFRGLGIDKVSETYLSEAWTCYSRWGASGKLMEIERLQPQLRARRSVSPGVSFSAGAGVVDLLSVMKASRAISGELHIEKVPGRLIAVVLELAGARKGYVLLNRSGALTVESEAYVQEGKPLVVNSLRSLPIADAPFLPASILNYARSSRNTVLLDDASRESRFSSDEYVIRNRPKSILCLPILRQADLVGLLYLENNLFAGAFTADRLEVLELLALQATISLDNAKLFDDLRRENEERRRAELRFQKVFHASPAPLAIFRLSDLTFADVNESNLKALGFSREEVIGRTPAEIGMMTSDFLLATRDALLRGTLSGEEMRLKTKSGETKVFLVSVERIELGGEDCALSAALDITERMQAEEQLRQAQKMEALGSLAGGVAHDFNNLLTAINGYSELALMGKEATSPDYEYLKAIRSSGDRAAGLTRQLLAFSRKETVQTQVQSLNAIVAEMEGMLRRLIEENVEFKTRLDPEAGSVNVDKGQVVQVLMNLVVNARDAMPNGGRLLVETRRVHLDKPTRNTLLEAPPGGYVALSVKDTGTGMTPEVKAKILEPFFTTKPVGKGTGLGLAVLYGVVKQLGGGIDLQSEPGQGTTFCVYFPEVREGTPAAVSEAAGREQPESYRGSETILVVEDEDSVRKFIKLALMAQGYTVLESRTGVEALHLLEQTEQRIDLVVTDLIMPDMGGRELATHVRAHRPALPVLYTSGYSKDMGDFQEALAKAEYFLSKPFGPLDLARKVREILEHSRQGA